MEGDIFVNAHSSSRDDYARERDDREIIDLLKQVVHELRHIRRELKPANPPPTSAPTPTAISFTQQGDPMALLPPVAGNTLVYTGTLSPAGAAFPTDSVFAVTSSDPAVSPSVDATGLVVTIPLPSTFVDNPASPFSVGYTATSASTGMSLTASIVPSVPAVVPTGITFAQTT
jgi:hypothetical protein